MITAAEQLPFDATEEVLEFSTRVVYRILHHDT